MSSSHHPRRPAPSAPGSRGIHRWARVRALLSLGTVVGLGAVGTMAAWSDTATAATGMFSTSSVNVEVKLNGQGPTYSFAALNKINLTRGASAAGLLPVNNTGDTDFSYIVQAVTGDAGTASYGSANANTFAQNLTVEVFAGGSSNGTACTGGTAIAQRALSLGEVGLVETPRTVDTGQTDELCFQVTVNPNAPVAARMSAVDVNFTFAATQA